MHRDITGGFEIHDGGFPRGRITHALFDFDGTISLIRSGWEEVMQELMEQMISGSRLPATPALRREISRYIDESTGVLTIEQMRWLEAAVRRWKLNPEVLSPGEYKRIYNEKLLEEKVSRRVGSMNAGVDRRFMLEGAVEFCERLSELGAKLFLASGTDHPYVKRESTLLGLAPLFGRRIYGALEDTEEYSKENIIRRILATEVGAGDVMLVAGDGPVEIRAAREFGAVALGVASDESGGRGWNLRKVERLRRAGAHILIPDFSDPDAVLGLIHDPTDGRAGGKPSFPRG